MKTFFYITLLCLLTGSSLFAQDWIVPDEQTGKRADFEFSDANRESGASIYLTNCRSCHGMPGEGNSIILVPPPGDPALEKFQNNNDGELYYKIREGKGQMASFKKILTIRQVWDVIAYLRSFKPDYIQEIAEAAANNRWTDITIDLSLLAAEHKLRAEVSGLEGEARTPVAGAEIRLTVRRRFGNLQIGEVIMTNEQGLAFFNSPVDLPGDTIGNLSLIAQLDDDEEFGLVISETILPAGLPLTPVSLRAERAMWNTNKRAPIWLILTFSLGLLIVWGVIFSVLFQLRTIFVLGEYEEKQ